MAIVIPVNDLKTLTSTYDKLVTAVKDGNQDKIGSAIFDVGSAASTLLPLLFPNNTAINPYLVITCHNLGSGLAFCL